MRYLRAASPDAGRAVPALAQARPHRRRRDAVQPHAAPQRRADAPEPLSAPRAPRRVRADASNPPCRTTSTASPGCSPTCSPSSASGSTPRRSIRSAARGRSRSPAPSGGRARAARRCSPGTATTISSAAARPGSAISTSSTGSCRAGSSSSRTIRDYPYDFLYCESTHPVRVDNGPPDPRMPEFVKRWNAEDRPFKFRFVTTTEFGTILRDGHGNAIGRQRGDWTDHWTDGPGSSAYETGVNRATHEILGAGEAIEAWLRSRRRAAHGAPARAADDLRRTPPSSTSTPGAPIRRSKRRTRSSRGRSGTASRAMPTPPPWRRMTSSPAPPARSPSRSARRDRKAFSTSATSSRKRPSSLRASTRCWSSIRFPGSGRSSSRSRSRAAAPRRTASSTASSIAAAAGAESRPIPPVRRSPARCRRWATPSCRSPRPTLPISRPRRA